MNTINKILANWWARIAVFLLTFPLFLFIAELALPADLFCGVHLSLFFATLLPNIIVEYFRVHKKFYLFGLMINSSTLREILMGTAIAVANIFIIFLAAYSATSSEVTMHFYFDSSLMMLIFDIFLLVCFEEFIFRGIIFQAFFERFGKPIAVIVFSIFFASVHIDPMGFNWIFFINVFLAGALISLMYIQTKSLWLPIMFHFFWNILQQLFLTSPISGHTYNDSFIDLGITNLNATIFGGALGIEGGLLTTALLLIDIYIVLKFAKIAPQMNALLFKRYYAESELLYNSSI